MTADSRSHLDGGRTLDRRQYSAPGMRGGLGKTLLTAFLLLAIVPLALLAFTTYNQIQSDTRRKVLSSLETIVALEEAYVVDWAGGCERELGLLADLCGDVSAPDEACVARAATWLTETQAAALVLVQANQEGRHPQEGGLQVVTQPRAALDLLPDEAQELLVIAGNDGVLDEGSPADGRLAALKDGIAGGGMVILPASGAGALRDNTSTMQPLLAIDYQLPGDGRYLVALFPWQSLQRLISALSSADRPDVTARVSLATRNEDSGFWILSPEGDLRDVAETLSEQGLEQAPSYAALGTVSNFSGAGLYTDLAGVPVLGAYRWNPQLQVAVVAEQPQADVLATGNTITAVIVAITLGMALVTAAIAALVTRQVTRPIVQLTETAARMARGDLNQPLDGDLRQVAVTRHDEIGVLARAFNHMAAELRVLYADLNARVELLMNMSHALRTPLTSIIGFSRLMSKELDGPLTDLQRTDLAAIHEGGQQLLGLINDMLELSDLELETAPMTIDEVDLAGLVDGVMATARALALNKPVELFGEVADNLPTLYTDGRRVRRVLLALMSNAIRITDEGSIRLSATAGDGRVTFGVQAIGAKGQAEIFDKSPGPPETYGTGNGAPSSEEDLGRSGLGLTISRQTVEKLDGRIWVESSSGGSQGLSAAYGAALYDGPATSEGTGSVFIFTVPISPSDNPHLAKTFVDDGGSA